MNLTEELAEFNKLNEKRLPYAWSYDDMGSFVVGTLDDNKYTRICDLRGWGHLTGGGGGALNLESKQAVEIQDCTGKFIAASPRIHAALITAVALLEQAREVIAGYADSYDEECGEPSCTMCEYYKPAQEVLTIFKNHGIGDTK